MNVQKNIKYKHFVVDLDGSIVHVCNTSCIMLFHKLFSFLCNKTVYYVLFFVFFRKTSEVTKLSDESTFRTKARNSPPKSVGLSNIELTQNECYVARPVVISMTSNDCYVTSSNLQTNGAEYEDMDQYCTIPE